MKSILSLLFVSALITSAGSAAVNYVQLEHLQPAFLTTLQNYTGNLGFTNFQGTQGGDDYMITLFFDVSSPLNIVHQADATDSFATGAYGINVYNMTMGTTLLKYSSQSASLSLLFKELDHNVPDAYYEDNISTFTPSGAYFYYSEGNGNTGIDTTSLLNTNGGTITTLAGAGFPFAESPSPGNIYSIFSLSGGFSNPNPVEVSSIHSSGLLSAVPEPSTALLGALAAFGLLRRRRR